MSTTPFVALRVWGVPGRAVPAAVAAMARDRIDLRRVPGLRFAKLMGTGSGATFTVRDSDPHHWAVLTCWDDAEAAATFERTPMVRRWRRRSHEELQVSLRPLASKGEWSRRRPFGDPTPSRHDGPVAAVTRGRLKPRLAVRFWRSVPPVALELHRSPGLVLSLGIGEAPIGLQGTFSLWQSAAALADFAYRQPAHRAVVERTHELDWYAEELFARFAVLDVAGTYRGQEVTAA